MFVVVTIFILEYSIDCYTVLALSQCGMRHELQLALITILWLIGLNVGWDCLMLRCIMGSRDPWEFPSFCKAHWQSPYTALTEGKCTPLGPYKETLLSMRWEGTKSHIHPRVFKKVSPTGCCHGCAWRLWTSLQGIWSRFAVTRVYLFCMEAY